MAIEKPASKQMVIASGRAHQSLAQEVAEILQTELVPVTAYDFANGETFVRYERSVRGVDAFIIQAHPNPINHWVMEQLLMVDAMKRASAKRITVVAPFFPYARQDKKHKGREPISARLLTDRSSDFETREGVTLPAYRGDAVNSYEFTEEARKNDAMRLLQAYNTSSSTLNLIRAFTTGGFADLREVHAWNRGFTDNPANKKYESIAGDIDRAMRFMEACGVDSAELRATEFFVSHEGLLFDYERPLTRIDRLQATDSTIHDRNVTIYADGRVDRSPCGSGTAARIAQLHHLGQMGPDTLLLHDSIVGTRFEGKIATSPAPSAEHGVVPEISGNSWLMAESSFILSESDPLPSGFSLR